MPSDSMQAYAVPFRALWLRGKDVIDLRFTGGPMTITPARANVIAHVANYRLLGVSLADTKRLGLGRWLRRHGERLPHQEGEPLPSGAVLYDEAARIAYFSVWPHLDGSEIQRFERSGKIYLDDDGGPARIRFHVTDRRGQSGALGPAAGLLPGR